VAASAECDDRLKMRRIAKGEKRSNKGCDEKVAEVQKRIERPRTENDGNTFIGASGEPLCGGTKGGAGGGKKKNFCMDTP